MGMKEESQLEIAIAVKKVTDRIWMAASSHTGPVCHYKT